MTKDGRNCRREGNNNNRAQRHGRTGGRKRGYDGHGIGSLGGAVERKGDRRTGRVEREQLWPYSWAGKISNRVTESENGGLRPLRYGKVLGFDKVNPDSREI